jgi:hypothetical protein
MTKLHRIQLPRIYFFKNKSAVYIKSTYNLFTSNISTDSLDMESTDFGGCIQRLFYLFPETVFRGHSQRLPPKAVPENCIIAGDNVRRTSPDTVPEDRPDIVYPEVESGDCLQRLFHLFLEAVTGYRPLV